MMKITSLVENTSATGMPVEHGLSLYIQLNADVNDNANHAVNILFDMGQGTLFAENAERLGVDIADVDVAIVSHGHYDHGGGLKTFLELNKKAKVYVHKDAFQPHYSLRENGLAYIGLDPLQLSLKGREKDRIVLCGDQTRIGDKMTLFADVHGRCCCPTGNRLLFEDPLQLPLKGGENETPRIDALRNDRFTHEQNLVIEEGDKVVLFAGCAHNGIVNIMRKAETVLRQGSAQVIGKKLTHVLGGMHLVKSGLSEEEENAFIADLAEELMFYTSTGLSTGPKCKFYTMHCTGVEQYRKLKSIMGERIEYLSCGDSLILE